MTKPLTLSAIAALIVLGLAPQAQSWERKESVELPNGKTRSVDVTGTCDGPDCTRDVVRVGPNGRTTTTTGTRSCVGGSCTVERIRTGPNDRTITRRRTIKR
ncbi:MAG: hypothetical protein AAFR46_17590 [Pseudomonadota bacterium]